MDQNGNASERREGGEEVGGGAEASEECGVAETRAYRAEHRSKEARLLVDAEHDARRSGCTRLGEGEARGVDEVAADRAQHVAACRQQRPRSRDGSRGQQRCGGGGRRLPVVPLDVPGLSVPPPVVVREEKEVSVVNKLGAVSNYL